MQAGAHPPCKAGGLDYFFSLVRVIDQGLDWVRGLWGRGHDCVHACLDFLSEGLHFREVAGLENFGGSQFFQTSIRKEVFSHTPTARSPTFPFRGRRTEEYGLSDRQLTDASDRAVDSRVVLVRVNHRLHHFRRRTC